jgi:hypothetical protein
VIDRDAVVTLDGVALGLRKARSDQMSPGSGVNGATVESTSPITARMFSLSVVGVRTARSSVPAHSASTIMTQGSATYRSKQNRIGTIPVWIRYYR